MRNYVFLNIRKAFERTTELVSISPTFYEQTFRTKVFYADFFYFQFCFVIICLKNICKKSWSWNVGKIDNRWEITGEKHKKDEKEKVEHRKKMSLNSNRLNTREWI